MATLLLTLPVAVLNQSYKEGKILQGPALRPFPRVAPHAVLRRGNDCLNMAIGVLRFEQSTSEVPQHHISKSLCTQFLAYFHHGKRCSLPLDRSTIKIAVDVPFGTLKALVRAAAREETALKALVQSYTGPMPPVEISGCAFKPPANFRQNSPHFISNYCTPGERVTYA